MIENLKKKVFHLFLGISLKRRLFITYLLLSSLILMLTSVFFYTASKKVLIKRAALSSQQQLSLITSNLGEKIDNISNYAITLSINSNIADVLKENPTVPENTLEHFLVNSELTDQAQRIIGLHKNIYAWDILDTENHWFHSSTTETDQLDSILGPEVLDSLQTNLAFQFLGPFQISGEPTFVALKSITNIDNTKYLGALVLLIRETNISSAFRDLPDSSSRDFYISGEPTFVALKSITNIDNTKYLGALVLLIRETNISSAFRDLPDSSSRDFYITELLMKMDRYFPLLHPEVFIKTSHPIQKSVQRIIKP